MNMQVYCNDLYDLNTENTQLYDEHKKWYNEFKASSIGDLLDKQQDMIDSYKRAVDNSTMEIADLKDELARVRKESNDYKISKKPIETLNSSITERE